MFTIEDAPAEAPRGRLYVVDHERGVWLQRVSGIGRSESEAFQLVQGQRVIPFNMSAEPKLDPNTGQKYRLRRFESFGTSGKAKASAGIEPFVFSDDREKQQFLLLAIEAVLVYGFHYSSGPRFEGDVRVEIDGQSFTLGSFGYPTEN